MVKTRKQNYGTPRQLVAEVDSADEVEVAAEEVNEEVNLPLPRVDPPKG